MFSRLLKSALWMLTALGLFAIAVLWHRPPNDYQSELGKIEAELVKLRDTAGADTQDAEAPFKPAYYRFLKASLTGGRKDLALAADAFDQVLRTPVSSPDFALLQADFSLKRHDLNAAKAHLAAVDYLEDNPKRQILQAEIDSQEGRYSEAIRTYETLIDSHPTWDTLARLAHLRGKTGDFDAADRLYAEAGELIPAKEPRPYAWIELQRGYLALNRGRPAEAEAHYRRAAQAYSGYWLVDDYRAELLARQGRFDAAIALYRQLAACTQRPEFAQTIADLYQFIQKPDLAAYWYAQALSVYLDAAQGGAVQDYHHLSTLYADGLHDGTNAVSWARKDFALRPNASSADALAWALFRDGQYPAATEMAGLALGYGWRDAHLLFHTGMIYLAAGRTDQGGDYLRQAAAIDPQYDAFHVHR